MNEGADECAKIGAEKAGEDEIDLLIPPELRLTGAKLSQMSQRLAYQAIREEKEKRYTKRRRTQSNIEKAQIQVEDTFGVRPTEATLWENMKHRDFSKPTQYFLWMTTHDAYMVGDNWKRAGYKAELQERGDCQHCNGALESMEHILTQCHCCGQETIWNLARELLETKTTSFQWRTPTLGTVIGCGSAYFINGQGRRLTGAERLYRITIAESAYLIWKLRCERVIGNENRPHSEDEVTNRWAKMINDRLKLDQNMTNPAYGKKALHKRLVIATWRGTLYREEELPYDWTGASGVLVGSVLRRGERRDRGGEG